VSRKHVTSEYKVISAGAMVGNLSSAVTDVEQCDHARYTGIYTGIGLSGSFHVFSSNDQIKWTELDIAPLAAIAAGDDFNILITLIDFKYLQLRYAASAGVGTLNAWIKSASIGA
jgi:hypothetical protein